jgi:hypothetical protein
MMIGMTSVQLTPSPTCWYAVIDGAASLLPVQMWAPRGGNRIRLERAS